MEQGQIITTGGHETFYNCAITKSQREFEEAMDISAAMSLNYSISGRTDAKFEFSKQFTSTETSIIIVAKCTIRGPVEMINPYPTQFIPKDLYLNRPDEFKQMYGDMFVQGITKAAAFYGVCQIYTTSTQEQTNLALSLSNRIGNGPLSDSLSVSIRDAIKESASYSETKIACHALGPTIELPTDLESMAKTVSAFPTYLQNIETDYSNLYANLVSYDTLSPGPDVGGFENRDKIIAVVYELRSQALTKKSTIQYILSHPSFYPDSNVEQLNSDISKLDAFLFALQERLGDCKRSYQLCNYQDLAFPQIAPFPERKILPTGTVAQGHSMSPGELLYPHQSLVSKNGIYELDYQGDGNLVLYRTTDGKALWASNTNGTPTGVFIMEADGNLAIYSSGPRQIWSLDKHWNNPGWFSVQDDGNLVIYVQGGIAGWASDTMVQVGTVAQGHSMSPGELLYANQSLTSKGGRYKLFYQGDGNLVLYRTTDGKALWASNTNGERSGVFTMEADGNLAIYAPGAHPVLVWTLDRHVSNPGWFSVQDDGNLVDYNNDNTVLWASNTEEKT